jgi:mono/diheme cytochrome c family protein
MKRITTSNVVVAVLTAMLLFTGAVLFAFSGLYNVAATREHGAAFRWMVSAAMRRSVQFHAVEIPRPAPTAASALAHGAMHFKTMCVACHGEPGAKPSEMGLGLNPKAPELSETVGRWSDSELHWIISNGIKMTGMPAFGTTHGDAEIWALVDFLRNISGHSPQQYRRQVDSLEEISHPKPSVPEDSEEQPRTWKRKSLF